jgi:hypothetical protein
MKHTKESYSLNARYHSYPVADLGKETPSLGIPRTPDDSINMYTRLFSTISCAYGIAASPQVHVDWLRHHVILSKNFRKPFFTVAREGIVNNFTKSRYAPFFNVVWETCGWWDYKPTKDQGYDYPVYLCVIAWDDEKGKCLPEGDPVFTVSVEKSTADIKPMFG